jgi:FMN-dependent NADH-azoreductase
LIDAKYALIHGQPHSGEEASAWRHIEDVINRFKAPDWYLFSLPMWNFGFPDVLKHYIDVIVQPGLTFGFGLSEGYAGLVKGNTARAEGSGRKIACDPPHSAELKCHGCIHYRGILGFWRGDCAPVC